ncbi:MAG TPA: allantoinase AllB [bacterium]|nr:allantoinase AllB [bacterium]
MKADLAIVGGRVATDAGVFCGTVLISGGIIAALVGPDRRPAAEDVLDATGRIVLPGGVDPHVHFNEPGRTHWEGFETGSAAAAAGGITTVIEMPLNANPPTTDARAFGLKVEAIRSKAFVDYALWGGLVADNVDRMEGLERSGALAYKAFMIDTGTEFTRADDGVLWEGMEKIAAWGSLLGVHAENHDLAMRLQSRFEQAGRRDMRAWCEARPPQVELEAIRRVLGLARATACRLHIVHLSTPEGGSLIAAARHAGQPVSVETCPHYLLLDEAAFAELGPVAKCAPPLRARAAVEGLWRQVLDGTIDCLSSDHAPCPPEDKARGADDVWRAWGGISGVQTLLPLTVSEGVHRRGMPLERLVALTSANAARTFGLYPRKGSLLPGADADIVIVDPDREWTITADRLRYRHRLSPFLGWRVKGWVERVLVRGRTIVRDGEVVGEPGHGRLIRRSAEPRVP